MVLKSLLLVTILGFFILSLSDCKRTECNRGAESEIRKRQISKWVNRKWKVIMFSTETRWNYLLFCQWDSTFWQIICWWLVFLTKWPKRDFDCLLLLLLLLLLFWALNAASKQFGFRPYFSTRTALPHLTDNNQNMVVVHEVFLWTFRRPSIPLIITCYCKNWWKSVSSPLPPSGFDCTSQTGHKSHQLKSTLSPTEMPFGVTQRCILGPLLFLIYVNDLSDCHYYFLFFHWDYIFWPFFRWQCVFLN